jgi:crossover junction endodeoxyribonuclease RusA
VIVLDLPRDLWFTSNDLPNMHYMVRSQKAAAVRALAAIAAKCAGETPVDRCRITVTASLPTARRFDPTNIAGTVSKHAIDGFTDAGLWEDDNSEHVVFVGFQRGPKTPGVYRLTFEIEEVA